MARSRQPLSSSSKPSSPPVGASSARVSRDKSEREKRGRRPTGEEEDGVGDEAATGWGLLGWVAPLDSARGKLVHSPNVLCPKQGKMIVYCARCVTTKKPEFAMYLSQ